jgi:hypothetical protein
MRRPSRSGTSARSEANSPGSGSTGNRLERSACALSIGSRDLKKIARSQPLIFNWASLFLFKLTEDFVSQTGEKFGFSQKSVAFLEPRSHLGKGTRALRERLSHPD